MTWTEGFESFPHGIKLVFLFLFGCFFGGLFRILRFFETGHFLTLLFGVLFLCSGIGNILAWILDFLTEASCNRICIFAN